MTSAFAEALDSLRTSMVMQPQDFSLDDDSAWQYGIVVGWGDALDDVAARHRWDAATVARLRRLRAAVEALPALAELHADLLRQAEACDEVAAGYDALSTHGFPETDRGDAAVSAARVRGKAQAYRHAAEMLRGAAQ